MSLARAWLLHVAVALPVPVGGERAMGRRTWHGCTVPSDYSTCQLSTSHLAPNRITIAVDLALTNASHLLEKNDTQHVERQQALVHSANG